MEHRLKLATVLGVASLVVGVAGVLLSREGRAFCERRRKRAHLRSYQRRLRARQGTNPPERARLMHELDDIERALARLRNEAAGRFRWTKRTPPLAQVPSWSLYLMTTEDELRYRAEWGAHLFQLVAEGDIRLAKRDRRRLARAAIVLAVVWRTRRALRRVRRGLRAARRPGRPT